MAASPPKIMGKPAVRVGGRYRRLPGPIQPMVIDGIVTVDGANVFVNREVRYVRDRGDVWQKPEDTLALKAGDCEDIALLKCALLAGMGFPWWLVLVYDQIARQNHAVAAGEHWLLDLHVDRLLEPDENLWFTPKLAMNNEATFVYGEAV